MNTAVEIAKHVASHAELAQYPIFLQGLQRTFEGFLASAGHLFHTRPTSAEPDLFDTYLTPLAGAHRQYHNCSACRHFVNHYGGLVHVAVDGSVNPVLWNPADAPDDLRTSVSRLRERVLHSMVTGPLVTSERALGQANTNGWDHMAVRVPDKYLHKDRVTTAGQRAAEYREEYRMLNRALGEFDGHAAAQAVALLKSGTLGRADMVVAQAEWFQDLHRALQPYAGQARGHLLWKLLMTSPKGYAHMRSGALGTLLQDIAAGTSAAQIKAKFDAMMAVYRRPTAAPKAGNIQRGEEIIAKLGLAPALQRRFARLEEVQALWTPSQAANLSPEIAPPPAGVFSHLKPAKAALPALVSTKPVPITWDKFMRTVLPGAQALQVWTPATGVDNYCALVTATDPSAPPLLQWDRDDRRNPMSWYRYAGGSAPARWGLPAGAWVDVTAVCEKPCRWGDGDNLFTRWGTGGVFLLAGAKDAKAVSLALFPESLRAELLEVRNTLAHYSNGADLSGKEDASACGVMVSNDLKQPVRVAVSISKVVTVYDIDRID